MTQLDPEPFLELWTTTDRSEREGEVERLAWLGCKAVRCPILWSPSTGDGVDGTGWSRDDGRLAGLQQRGLRPILELFQHRRDGRSYQLLDPEFPEQLAAHARAIATQYPWAEDWIPIAEVGLIARGATLSGRGLRSGFVAPERLRVVVNLCRAIALCMQSIRQVIPRARLIQPEDLGRVSGRPQLEQQVDRHNELRFLPIELLTGRVGTSHPLWADLLEAGVDSRTLIAFSQSPTPPDVLGVNYRPTSDRFLDDRVERYARGSTSGSFQDGHADAEAVRVAEAGITGHVALLWELWGRYSLPLAITDVQADGAREEQLRWFGEAWQAAARSQRGGVDVRAVAGGAAFGPVAEHRPGDLGGERWGERASGGASGRDDARWQPGLFDYRTNPPRPTVLGQAVYHLARARPFSHPTLAVPGWWRRPDRVLFPSSPPGRIQLLQRSDGDPPTAGGRENRASAYQFSGPPLVITGAGGTLGGAFARLAAARGLACRLLGRAELDITDAVAVNARLAAWQPWAVINAAGYAAVDEAEQEPERCYRDNVVGARVLSEACGSHGARLVLFSSDLVFDGQRTGRYLESAPTDPLSVYGRCQVEAEREAQALMGDGLIVRTAACFGPWDGNSFVSRVLRDARAGRMVQAAEDVVISPTYLPDLVEATLDLLIDGEQGIWHLANDGATSWADLARLVLRLAKLDSSLVQGYPARELRWLAPRPAFSVLGSERGQLLRPLDEALAAFLQMWETATEPGPRGADRLHAEVSAEFRRDRSSRVAWAQEAKT